MKTVLIVTYDLKIPGQNSESLLRAIKTYEEWAKLGESSYLIYTESTVVQVRDNLGKYLLPNDRVYVSIAPAPAAWSGLPDDVAKWIHSKLG